MNVSSVPAGCHRLHLLLQDTHERRGRPGPAGQPVAGGQQHHRLPPPPHPLRPLLPAGPAGTAPPRSPRAQPPERPALAGPQVVQPGKAPPTPLTSPTQLLNTAPPPSFVQDPVQLTIRLKQEE